MGKLDEALEKAGGGRGGGLGGATGPGGVRLQSGRPGTSAEDQIEGEVTQDEPRRDTARPSPTSPRGISAIEAAE